MAHLEDLSADELRGYLAEVDDKQPSLRLIAGINYKEGIAATTIADWYDISTSTVHNWLNRLERLEDEPMEAVIHDAPRSGRPKKLSSEEWNKLNQILDKQPNEVGIEAPHWTPRIVQHLIEEKFDTEYTKRHVQVLLHQTGYTWKTARPEYAKGDERARNTFKEGFKKTDSQE